jgi:hypothetical protein
MKMRALAAGLIVAASFVAAQPAAAQQAPEPGQGQMNERVLPIAVGALFGAAASFFILPLVIPTMAVTAAGATAVTSGPAIALVGAGVGGLVGYAVSH